MKDYYRILELSPNATPDEIKAQYRLMLNAWHPDKHSNPEHKTKAEERTKEITEAYSVLSDLAKRAQYDRERPSQSSYSGDSERRRKEESERKRHSEDARDSYQRAEDEQRRREQTEADKRRSDYEHQQREKAKAERYRAEQERQQREKVEAERILNAESNKKAMVVFSIELVGAIFIIFAVLSWAGYLR